MYFNLVVCFLISGFWHGAEWTFIIWGLFHGIFLILDKLFLLRWMSAIGKLPSIIITFLLTLVGWVIFRATDFHYALDYLHRMFTLNTGTVPIHFTNEFRFTLLLALFLSFAAAFKSGERVMNQVYAGDLSLRRTSWFTLTSLILLLLSASAITSTGFNPFIYFRF
jgi:alginate O-acetyltransferase complex protein AlgI